MHDDVKQALIVYGLHQLAEMTYGDLGKVADRIPGVDSPAQIAWDAYEAVLAGGQLRPPEGVLTCIFSLISHEGRLPERRCYSAQPLALERKVLFPELEAAAQPAGPGLWDQFVGEFQQVPKDGLDTLFEIFYHLYHKYAWAVPCTYGEPGVSLFEQWKAVAALAFASGEGWPNGPAGEFTLIGGDIPGIQDFVYTITSKGAAKGLRGRSFFIQLLGDAVVRRILADLDLCPANVVYNAGGNFMVLGPAGEKTAETVGRVRRRVNSRLVEAIQGDTALVVETTPVLAADLFTPGQFKKKRDEFAGQVGRAKNRPLQELTDDWATLFKPRGRGSRLSCAVCRVEVDEHTSQELEPTGEVPEGAEPARICYLCNSFAELAQDIRYTNLWMAITERPKMLDTRTQPRGGWRDLLAWMTGFHYEFSKDPPVGKDKSAVLALNRPDFLAAGAHGFRLLANVTPTVTDEDRKRLREEGWDEEDIPKGDQIRSFAILAKAAKWAGAIERVGVLLMDADGLGRVFSEGVPDLTLPKLSALSGTIDLFFGGYLNGLVRAQAENDLYIIYAGGDDLFIVGAWHHLPDLAEVIRNEFKAFTGDHPVLSLSGGITLEGAKFPLYRAAERAGEAEGRAKRYTRPKDHGKDALCFLEQAVGWEEWPLVRETEQRLFGLICAGVPRSLLRVVQILHAQFAAARRRTLRAGRKAGRELAPNQIYWDRWAWMAAYSLTRLAQGCSHQQKEEILTMQREWIESGKRIHFLGLAARWAEYQLRGGER